MAWYLLILGTGVMGDVEDIEVVMDSESKWSDEMHGRKCETCEI